jgi:hypothetical protein
MPVQLYPDFAKRLHEGLTDVLGEKAKYVYLLVTVTNTDGDHLGISSPTMLRMEVGSALRS